ncbi:hypothetical protein SS50377_20981 [Spironucleus salmonicida]|uniref:Uncharacterized protein n=1 Tax=Spironucleus salmonicida TaxID=348837 RepID=A0A9P8S2E3_9EUKA|nr:hypothetical protein SS50377_20981 [Spironucleus salmonicida]
MNTQEKLSQLEFLRPFSQFQTKTYKQDHTMRNYIKQECTLANSQSFQRSFLPSLGNITCSMITDRQKRQLNYDQELQVQKKRNSYIFTFFKKEIGQ